MGCCQASPPSPQEQKSAFADYTKHRDDHHAGDSNYTLSSVQKTKNSAKYYETRVKSSPSNDGVYVDDINNSDENDENNNNNNNNTELAHLNTQSSTSSNSSSSNTSNSTKRLIKHKKDDYNNNNKERVPSASPKEKANPLPFDKHTFKSTLSPNNKPQTQNSPSLKSKSNNSSQRRNSISKSKSRSFRPRKEPKSPSNNNNIPQIVHNDPPPIVDDDDIDVASSDSDNVEIPGLKAIIFDDTDNDDDTDDDDDENLIRMALLVQQENERLALEIKRVKSVMSEQEEIKLKQEAYDEIEKEANENINNNINEEEKKRKALLRYEKKQKQRMKEKEEAKERRRLKKEEKKKKKKAKLLKQKMKKRQEERLKKRQELRDKRKQELQNYSIDEQRPNKQQIINIFDKYFYSPFQIKIANKPRSKKFIKKSMSAQSMSSGLTDSETDTSDTDQDENLGEKGINFDGFKAGLKLLNIDTILTKGQIELLFDHMTASSREYGINAVDFCHFLKQNIITLEPKLADIQRKLLSTLAKQQDKEDMSPDKEEDDQIIKSDTIIIKNENNETEINNTDDDDRNRTSVIVHENINKSDNSDDTIEEHNEINNKQLNSLGSMPKMIIQISEPEPHINIDGGMSPKGHDIITPDTPKGHDNDNDDTDSDDDEEEETIDGNRYGRKQSVSISESMSVSVSQSMKIPSNIPRKSFKQINYNWNDSISKKSFNNYKKLREKFGLKYNQKRREKNKTKDAELMKVHEQIFSDKLDHLLQDMNDNKIDDNDKENKMNISNVLDENKFESVPVNRPQIITRKSSASSKKKMVSNLSNIDETKEHDDIPEMATEIAMGRSAVQSLQRVDEYKGNDEINNLRKLYKQQFKMKQKLERLRKRSLLSFPAPRKPKDITELIDDKTSYICKELQQCICKNTRYTGLANFGPNGELGIEIEFTSDCDENGYITGKRVIHFKGLKQAVGRGRIWIDLYWNGHKYVPCTKFEWIDEGEGVTTKFTFDSYKHEIDVDHSFFQGNCVRYPSDLDPRKRSTKLIMHEGFFDFVCVSARRRNIRRNSLLQYHTLDINEMDENELEKVPKYVRRMSAYTEKIDQLYEADAPFTKETLFGDAINTVAAISEQDPITSDASIPEQINE